MKVDLIPESELAKLDALDKAATPGPWSNKYRRVVWRDPFINADGNREHQPICDADTPAKLSIEEREANANFVAEARTALPRVVKELREVRKKVADYKEMHEDKRLLSREIGGILYGLDAPAQPSLCDLVGPIRDLKKEVERLQILVDAFKEASQLVDSSGDPDGITPGDVATEITALRIAKDGNHE